MVMNRNKHVLRLFNPPQASLWYRSLIEVHACFSKKKENCQLKLENVPLPYQQAFGKRIYKSPTHILVLFHIKCDKYDTLSLFQALGKLMNDIKENLGSKNKDCFTQNVNVLRKEVCFIVFFYLARLNISFVWISNNGQIDHRLINCSEENL